MIDHNVMRLYVSVHDSLAVAKVQRLQQFVNVEPHIEVVELGIQAAEIDVVNVLENQRRRLALHMAKGSKSHHISKVPQYSLSTTQAAASKKGGTKAKRSNL